MKERAPSYARVHTIYLGGGTPSQLDTKLLQRIFLAIEENFDLSQLDEVTIEANPDDVTSQWLEALQHTPVNRISMGVQTFDDALLRLLRRRHTASEALDAVRLCRQYGFENLSLDLIYGLPGQTFASWQKDVDQLLALHTPHISAYSLSFEEGTVLHKMLEKGEVSEVSDEEQWQMYSYLMDATAHVGMQHYEISNFALPGYQSRHNSSYWDGTPYIGLGPGAHSYDGKAERRSNNPSLKDYCEAYASAEAREETSKQPFAIEHLTTEERYDELIMTRLRTSAGLPLSLLTDQWRTYCLDQARPFLAAGQLTLQNDVLRLTRSGIFTSNAIIAELFA